MNKLTNPIQDLFGDIKKIISFIEIKDDKLAKEAETTETRDMAEVWMAAMEENDNYITYRRWWDIGMFQLVMPNVKWNDFKEWNADPSRVPVLFRETLRVKGREVFLSLYEERNAYYRTLAGLPPIDTPEDEYIHLSEELRNEFNIPDIPVHELSTLLQNYYIVTEEYKQAVINNPTKKYLRYLGSLKVDIYNARKAYDFELIRSLPHDRSDINPNLLKEFVDTYSAYRDYVKGNIYNEKLEGIFVNYREFLRITIISWTIMQICNKAVEAIPGRKFLDDSVLYLILSMYGIPRSLLMTKEVRRSLVINLLKLTKNKAVDDVYYDLVKILGYSDIIISKLMLMKGQEFDDNGNVIMENGEPKVTPYFLKMDLLDQDPYSSLSDYKVDTYSYKSIIDKDPSWWDTTDTRKLLKETNYSMADSKYIEIEAVIHQVRYLFESIFFTRMIIDNKRFTETFMITIPEIFGAESISIYDLMIYVVVATCMSNGLTGAIITEEDGLLATPGFNFNMDIEAVLTFLKASRYIDKEKVILFLENINMSTMPDIGRIYYEVLYPMRDWIQHKISNTSIRQEYLEYEALYKALYSYDASQSTRWYEYTPPMNMLREKYNLSEEDVIAYQHYYPRNYDGTVMDYDTFLLSRYNPFVDSIRHQVAWFVKIPSKGNLYFHDILNSRDLRELKASNGDYMFLDNNGKLDNDAIRDAINLINNLDSNELKNAVYRANTPVIGTDVVYEGASPLPTILRTGIHKSLLIDKIKLDMDGMAKPPTTYKDYLYRRNRKLYDLLYKNDRYNTDRVNWQNDLMTIILAIETELNMHLKYFELSAGGGDLFFKPLTTLINRFKSTLVSIAKTSIKHIFGDKLDAGGNSNTLPLFDSIVNVINFVLSSKIQDYKKFGLYDAINKVNYSILCNDYNRTGNASMRMIDEIKIYKNGKEMDKAEFRSGEDSGRWENEERIIMRARTAPFTVLSKKMDTNYWKNLVESINE